MQTRRDFLKLAAMLSGATGASGTVTASDSGGGPQHAANVTLTVQ